MQVVDKNSKTKLFFDSRACDASEWPPTDEQVKGDGSVHSVGSGFYRLDQLLRLLQEAEGGANAYDQFKEVHYPCLEQKDGISSGSIHLASTHCTLSIHNQISFFLNLIKCITVSSCSHVCCI